MTQRRRPSGALALAAFEGHPHGLLVLGPDGTPIGGNPAADALLGRGGDVVGPLPSTRRLLEHSLTGKGAAPEVRVELPEGAAADAAWITAARLPGARVLLVLRPVGRDDDQAPSPASQAKAPLRIFVLGRTRVEIGAEAIGGRWLENRAGEVLKYLVATRYRPVSADEIAEELGSEVGARSVQGVRYFIHALRTRLEPSRPPRGESSFVCSTRGGYVLDSDRVWVDADEFEGAVTAGRAAGDAHLAQAHFARACELYRGDFLADEPYAEWATAERDRLRALTGEALRALAASAEGGGDLDAAARHLERLTALEHFDVDVHRALIALCLRRGRRSEALRRYASLRRRLLATFGEDLDFTLADLAGEWERDSVSHAARA